MPIVEQPIFGNSEKNSVPNTVEITAPFTLRVAPGPFRIGGAQYELLDEQVFTGTSDAVHATEVHGYLAEDIGTGQQVLLVDEIVVNGENAAFVFDGVAYNLIHRLFFTVVEPGAVAFGDVGVYRVIPRGDD